MKVLGLTQSNKAVNDNEGLDINGIFDLYKDFTPGDHYDAACIWSLETVLDHRDAFRNIEFHLANLSLSLIDIKDPDRKKEMMARGRLLRLRKRLYDRMHTTNGPGDSPASQ